MTNGRLAPALACALASVAMLGACGGEEAEPPPPRPTERPEQVPKLPRGWTVEENEAQGFALGAPPGWKRGKGCLRGRAAEATATVLCSPDELVTLSISADRTDEALELDPVAFAVRVLEVLGTEAYDDLKAQDPGRFPARYAGAGVEATATAKETGVRQDVTVVVLRRDGIANFTAVIAANAREPTEPAVKLAERALRTLRSQPPGPPGGP